MRSKHKASLLSCQAIERVIRIIHYREGQYHLKDHFFSTLKALAHGQKIDVLSVDDRDWKQTHEALVKGADDGAIVVLTGEKKFPYRLAHIAYVFNKDDGLVLLDGGTHRGYGLPSFRLICLMTPQAWQSIDSDLRDRLIQVTASGIHCYLNSPSHRDYLSVLEQKRWEAAKDPVKALKQAGSLEERHALFVELFPPDHREGTFDRYDEPIIDIIEKLTDEGSSQVQEDLLEIFAIHKDFYFAGQALQRDWSYREDTLDHLADKMAQTPYIAGQRKYFWDLMTELAERGRPRIRKLMEDLLSGSQLGAENVLYVLVKIRPWPQILEKVAQLSEKSTDLQVLDLCRQVMRNAQRLDVTKTQKSSLLDKIFGKGAITSRVGGLATDDYQHYYEAGLDMLTAKGKQYLESELQKLAAFQAYIQNLDVGTYPKSILTFERAVEFLILEGSWLEAVRFNHLASVSNSSEEYRLMENAIQIITKRG